MASSATAGTGGQRALPEDDANDPWRNTYLRPAKLPEGLTEYRYGNIETNRLQSIYQDYLSGKITAQRYEHVQKNWHLTFDTLNLSKAPVKTIIAFVYGKDANGELKMAIDANNNLDLSDDELFTPAVGRSPRQDAPPIEVHFEAFVHDRIVPVSAPLNIAYDESYDMFWINFSQYMTGEYQGEEIAVSGGFGDLAYERIQVALMRDALPGGEVPWELYYEKNEYIELGDGIYKLLGVNTNRQTLMLEKIDRPKEQLVSTQAGYKAPALAGEDFVTGAPISLEGWKGKYVYVDFWETSCAPCIAEFPNLKALYESTDRARFEIVGIVSRSKSDAVAALMEKHGVTWPQIVTERENPITEAWGVNSWPTTFLIGPDGTIVAKDLRGEWGMSRIRTIITQQE